MTDGGTTEEERGPVGPGSNAFPGLYRIVKDEGACLLGSSMNLTVLRAVLANSSQLAS